MYPVRTQALQKNQELEWRHKVYRFRCGGTCLRVSYLGKGNTSCLWYDEKRVITVLLYFCICKNTSANKCIYIPLLNERKQNKTKQKVNI